MKKLFTENNKALIQNLIPEKGSDFEYTTGLRFTDPLDIAFDHPIELSLPHVMRKDELIDEHLFI